MAVALLAGGLAAEAVGLLAGVGAPFDAGRWLAALGSVVHALVLAAVFAARGL